MIPPCTCCSGGSSSRPGAPPPGWTSCGAHCGSTRCSWRPTAAWATRSSPPGASPKPWSSGISGSGSPRARRPSWRSSTTCAARKRRPRPSAAPVRGFMADEIKTLSSQLAQDPDSLVFLAQGGGSGPARAAAAAAEELAPPAAAAAPLEESRVFAGLEGAQEGLLLLDAKGQVLGGALKEPHGRDVTEAVAAYLAGVSHEAGRTAKLLGLGRWTGVAAEGQHGHVHLTPPAGDALLLVVRDRAVPMGRLAIIAQRAAGAARRWLEQQA